MLLREVRKGSEQGLLQVEGGILEKLRQPARAHSTDKTVAERTYPAIGRTDYLKWEPTQEDVPFVGNLLEDRRYQVTGNLCIGRMYQ